VGQESLDSATQHGKFGRSPQMDVGGSQHLAKTSNIAGSSGHDSAKSLDGVCTPLIELDKCRYSVVCYMLKHINAVVRPITTGPSRGPTSWEMCTLRHSGLICSRDKLSAWDETVVSLTFARKVRADDSEI